MTTFAIITKRTSSGPEWHHEETRLFETTAKPENLEANYRNWIKRWADESGTFDLRYERFEILGAYRVEALAPAPLDRGIGRAIGMIAAERDARERAYQERQRAEREARERAELERLKAKYASPAAATQGV